MINIDFHLLVFENTLTFPDGEQKTFTYKSKGGRILLCWLIGVFLYSKYNNIDFNFWSNLLIGMGWAILWDITTAALYHLKLYLLVKKYNK